jgi:hypothetical protein
LGSDGDGFGHPRLERRAWVALWGESGSAGACFAMAAVDRRLAVSLVAKTLVRVKIILRDFLTEYGQTA